ncbi:hypothetical protein C2142_16110 [Streptomyces sp. CB01881]|nr:hypothetical protein C2142_16110 [Streptomyces sp. CB01881]
MGLVGVVALVAGGIATFKKDTNSVGVGGLFVVGVVLLLSAVSGQMPSSISFGKDQKILWAAKVASDSTIEDAKKQNAENASQASPEIINRFVQADDEAQVRDLVNEFTQMMNDKLEAPPKDDIVRKLVGIA